MNKAKRNVGVDFKIRLNELSEVQKRYLACFLPQKVYFTSHAKEQATKRKLKLEQNEVLKHISIQNVVEIQVSNTKRVTYLVRYPYYTTNWDIIIVLAQNGAVLTTWLNHKTDNHATLRDKHLYTTDLKKLQGVLK